jgi:hypothetical protein
LRLRSTRLIGGRSGTGGGFCGLLGEPA